LCVMSMSPTDTDQATVAVGFANEKTEAALKRKPHFLIIEASKPRNKDYPTNLIQTYRDMIPANQIVASTVVLEQDAANDAVTKVKKDSPDLYSIRWRCSCNL